MNEAKSYKVCILDDQYALISDESEDRVQNLAKCVDKMMREIADKAQGASHKKIAVLAALQFASKLLALEEQMQQVENVQGRLNKLIDGEIL